MTKIIDSDALITLNLALGLTGEGAPFTAMSDGDLGLTFDTTEIVRRGRTQAQSQGIYLIRLQNVHSAADDETTSSLPFAQTVGVQAPYPSPITARFDLWLLSATMRRVSGTGDAEGILDIGLPNSMLGYGQDDSGGAITGIMFYPVAYWSQIITAGGMSFGTLLNGDSMWKGAIRLPRNPATGLNFRSTSTALATYACMIMVGVFPTSLGQDGIS